MKSLTLAACAATVLLCACSSTPNADGQQSAAEPTYTPIGTFIPRKASKPADNVVIVDKQALENARNNGGGNMGMPSEK